MNKTKIMLRIMANPKISAVGGALLITFILCFYSPYRLEDTQTAIFPAITLVAVLIAPFRSLKLRAVVFFLLLMVWAASALHIRGYFFSFDESIVARLDDDPQEIVARALLVRSNQISTQYGFPGFQLIQRYFSGAEAERWSNEHPQALMLVTGNPYWMKVYLPRGEGVLRLAKFTAPFGGELKLLLDPVFLNLPAAPYELSRHFLAFISQSREASRRLFATADTTRSPQEFEDAAYGFYEAAHIDGQWKSHEPRGYALFALGNMKMLAALAAGDFLEGEVRCASDFYRRAAGAVAGAKTPGLKAAILNNIALAEALLADGEKDYRQVGKWLEESRRIASVSGDLIAAGAALDNLKQMREGGVL
ncbi:MAG: hypothetical protein PHC51_00825 [bacterium]|nr:hypothetical protein [bacterium]